MFKNYIIILIIAFFNGFAFSFGAFSQLEVNTVPDLPSEIRQLPEDFKEVYQNDSDYDYEESISITDRIKRWIIEKLMSWFDFGNKNAMDLYRDLKLVFYFLVLLGVAFLIYKLVKNKEFRWIFGKKPEKSDQIEDFESQESIQEADFNKLITNAVSEQDYRLAVKFYYLQLLKSLQDATILEYDPQKTTHDYQLDLEGTAYYKEFARAAYYYTYIWYGEFKIDEEEYATASNVFVQLLKQLGHE